MRSISCHITTLANNSLEGKHPHIHTRTQIQKHFKKPGEHWPAAGACPGLEVLLGTQEDEIILP